MFPGPVVWLFNRCHGSSRFYCCSSATGITGFVFIVIIVARSAGGQLGVFGAQLIVPVKIVSGIGNEEHIPCETPR